MKEIILINESQIPLEDIDDCSYEYNCFGAERKIEDNKSFKYILLPSFAGGVAFIDKNNDELASDNSIKKIIEFCLYDENIKILLFKDIKEMFSWFNKK